MRRRRRMAPRILMDSSLCSSFFSLWPCLALGYDFLKGRKRKKKKAKEKGERKRREKRAEKERFVSSEAKRRARRKILWVFPSFPLVVWFSFDFPFELAFSSFSPSFFLFVFLTVSLFFLPCERAPLFFRFLFFCMITLLCTRALHPYTYISCIPISPLF